MKSSRRLILLIVLIAAAIGACERKTPVYRKTKLLMDTVVAITVVSDSGEKADKAIDEAFEAIDRFGKKIDFFSETSEVAAITKAAGVHEVAVSPETLAVIDNAIFIAEKTDGAFDPTIGAESRLWNFAEKVRPSDKEIRRMLKYVNFREIEIDKNRSTVFLRKKGMVLDLGAIAKGYAADLAVAALKKNGIKAGIVANAGDIRTFGSKPDGSPWTVGIRNPRPADSRDEMLGEIRLNGEAISTAGDYERYFMEEGKRYHHILDPRTGLPSEASMSVTVIADTGVFSDGFDTGLFVLGPEKGIALAKELGLEALMIDRNGVRSMTPGMQRRLKFEKRH